jgi:hypothetical protein
MPWGIIAVPGLLASAKPATLQPDNKANLSPRRRFERDPDRNGGGMISDALFRAITTETRAKKAVKDSKPVRESPG